MSMIATAVIGGVATVAGAAMSSRSARKAADAQSRSAEQGIQEQRRQFDAATRLFQPYVQAGVGSLGQQEALLGLAGPEAQAEAIAAIENAPRFQALARQGEEAMLQTASATGGLRGGNIQAALGPDCLGNWWA
jgi:type II secretory pathway pseudopilin PulG